MLKMSCGTSSTSLLSNLGIGALLRNTLETLRCVFACCEQAWALVGWTLPIVLTHFSNTQNLNPHLISMI